MNSTAINNNYSTLPVSKWDAKIRNNKRRRSAEIRRHVFLLILAAVFLCGVLLWIDSTISEAGTAKERELSFKYYKNICVGEDETLTSIARTYADKEHYEDHASYIREVVYMNHLENADDIREGAYLIIPYYSNILY